VVGKVIVAATLAAVAAFVPDLPSLVAALVAMAVYATAVLVLRALPGELRELLPARR
jgi:L-lactate permease